MKKTLLVSSAGRRNQLLECFREDASKLGIELRVLAADANPKLSSACHAADRTFIMPRCTNEGFVVAMLDLCRREKVDLVVPTIDPELGPLSAARDAFAAIGTRIAISAPGVVALAGDKLATASALKQAGVGMPQTVKLHALRADPDLLQWPIVIKPNSGSASVGMVRLASRADLKRIEDDVSLIAQECWLGREYTVNVFFSASGELRCAVPHQRIEVRDGEVSKGRTERVASLGKAASKIASVLPGAIGPLCFQAIVREDGKCSVFEINARFGGGFPLTHHAGARFSAWLLEEACGLPSTASDSWAEGVTMLRYDSAIYFHD